MRIALLFSFVSISSFAYAQKPAFPLKRLDNKRYLVDQQNHPFLINAATGWQLYTKLTTEEAKDYFQLRKAQGFNTILTQVCMHEDDINRYQQRPFFDNNDFSKPNEAYFNHILSINKMADSMGLLIVMSQPWQGCCLEGWGMTAEKPLQRNGEKKCYGLGKYFGKKFYSLNNLMWIMGGDQDPLGDRACIEAMAKGIFESAPHQYITYHAKPTHSSTDLYQYAPWLGISMIYTYWRDKPNAWVSGYPQMIEVYEMALREYMKTDIMPFFLGEAQYEGFEGNDIGTAYIARRQAYWTVLCGGMGAAYGDDTWYFPPDWREKQKRYPGGNQLKHFYSFFNSIRWWKLVPDYRHQVLVKGYGEMTKTNYVTAALSSDSSFFVAYIPYQQTVTVDLTKLKGSVISAKWYDPRSGSYSLIGHYSKPDLFYFTPPTNDDWVLYLSAK